MSLFKGLEFDPGLRRQLAWALGALLAGVVLATVAGTVYLALRFPWLLLLPVSVLAAAVIVRGTRRLLHRRP